MASESIKVFCDLVSDTAINGATDLTLSMTKLLLGQGISVSPRKILTTFTFMNIVLVYGVWSNLPNEQLLCDLRDELRDALLLKLSFYHCKSREDVEVAAKATFLFDDYKVYLEECMNRMQQMDRYDSGVARLFALEQIQRNLRIDDSVMDAVILEVFPDNLYISQVEKVASQMVNEARKIRPKGFLRRIFGK